MKYQHPHRQIHSAGPATGAVELECCMANRSESAAKPPRPAPDQGRPFFVEKKQVTE